MKTPKPTVYDIQELTLSGSVVGDIYYNDSHERFGEVAEFGLLTSTKVYDADPDMMRWLDEDLQVITVLARGDYAKRISTAVKSGDRLMVIGSLSTDRNGAFVNARIVAHRI
jgi:single-stranded DNA-binding protein